jgi:hypothetical protein
MLKHINSTTSPKRQLASAEFSRILSAAVISARFRNMLLADPVKAISDGYSGEKFEIGADEKNRLANIRANSLADFAAQLSLI